MFADIGNGDSFIESQDAGNAGASGSLRAEKRVVYMLLVVAVAFLIVSLVLNALALRDRSMRSGMDAIGTPASAESSGAASYQPEQSAADMLPLDIIAYETITRHEVPGRGKQAGEAIYVTLNMDVEIQRPITVYARVEAFESASQAERALADKMADFATRSETVLVGERIAESGYLSDEGAWAVGWVSGSTYTFVKTTFRDLVPLQKKDFLRSVGRPVVEAIEEFQRTGRQGLGL